MFYFIILLWYQDIYQLKALVYTQDIIYTMRPWIHCHQFNVLLYFDLYQHNIILNNFYLLYTIHQKHTFHN